MEMEEEAIDDNMGLHYIGNLLAEDDVSFSATLDSSSNKKKTTSDHSCPVTSYPVVAPVKPLMGSSSSAGQQNFWPEPPPPYSPPLSYSIHHHPQHHHEGESIEYAKLFSAPTAAVSPVSGKLPPLSPPQKLSAVKPASFVLKTGARSSSTSGGGSKKAEATKSSNSTATSTNTMPVRIPGLNPVESHRMIALPAWSSKPAPLPPAPKKQGEVTTISATTLVTQCPKRGARAQQLQGKGFSKQGAPTSLLAKSTSSSNLLKLDSAKARFAVLNKIGSHSELNYVNNKLGANASIDGRQRRTHSMAGDIHGALIEKISSEGGAGRKRSTAVVSSLGASHTSASASSTSKTHDHHNDGLFGFISFFLHLLLSLLHLTNGNSKQGVNEDESESGGGGGGGGQHHQQRNNNGGRARGKRTGNRRREEMGAPRYYLAICLTSVLGVLQSAALWISHLAFDFVLLLLMAIDVMLRGLAKTMLLSVVNGWRRMTRFGRELVHNCSETHRRSKAGNRSPLEKRVRRRKR